MKYQTQYATIQGGGGAMKLLVLKPIDWKPGDKRTGVLWIHGGGYVTGMAGMVHMSRARHLVSRFGAVVVSPEYRLAGKTPYPAALESSRFRAMPPRPDGQITADCRRRIRLSPRQSRFMPKP